MNRDDDDNIIRFPTFVRIEGDEPSPAIKNVCRCYVLVNRETASVPLNDWANAKITTLIDQLNATLKDAGIERSTFGEKYSVYSLRHFYAVNALRNGVGVFEVARNMGT